MKLSLSLSATLLAALCGTPTTTVNALAGGFGASNKPTFVHTPDTSAPTEALIKFLKASGSKGLKNVEIGVHDETSVRGLFATKKIKKGQMICQIPSDCALALSDPAQKGEDVPTLAHAGANYLEMYANNAQAKKMWAPYLESLPQFGDTNFASTPDFFNDEELELLEFPRLIRQAKERKAAVKKVSEERGIDYDELQYATWLVSSRSFSITMAAADEDAGSIYTDDRGQVVTKSGDEKKISVLVPFIDMGNHNSDQPNVKMTLIDPEKDDAWFALEATRPIAAGKEVVLAYGSGVMSSAELFMNYGFVPSSNEIDRLMLKKESDETISSLDGWSTTLEEDKMMLGMAKDDPNLTKVLEFRIKLKESYGSDDKQD